MGKRKRTLSPKENNDLSSGPLKVKAGTDVKKNDTSVADGNDSGALRTETQDKGASSTSGDAEASGSADDRPTPQLRISARVQNKQKREENKGENLSSLNSVKKDGSSQDEDEEEDKSRMGGSGMEGEGDKGGPQNSGGDFNNGNNANNSNIKKRRRAWELWSLEDKNTFFEAINECGKDFEAIQNFLLTKLRKKGIPSGVIKNKDQVRHFYYRTWHKISKHIKFKDDVKKSTQELYTLINYGELRRKVGGTLDEKKGQKLQELIQKGSTSVRVKGKSVRVRTPICRALKKLNEFPDDRDQTGVRVPVSVNIEIVPANISSWNFVQSLAHNPRVRVSCSMHRNLKSLIEHLQNKWKSTKLKIAEGLISSANFPVNMSSPHPSTIIRLRPPPTTDFNNVIIKPDTQVKSFAVSLSSHSQMLQRKGETEFQSTGKSKTIKAPRKKKVSSSSGGTDSTKEGGKETESREKEKEDGNEGDKEVGKGKEEAKEKSVKEGGESNVKEEEMEEGNSDVEIEEEIEKVSPSATYLSGDADKDEEVVILACHSPRKRDNEEKVPIVVVKEEDPNSPVPISPSLPPSDYDQEVLNAVRNIKEEVTDPVESIHHQLMALENVASSREIEDDAEVVCIGENTRLSAQIRDSVGSRRRSHSLQLEDSSLSLTTVQIPPSGLNSQGLVPNIANDHVALGDDAQSNSTISNNNSSSSNNITPPSSSGEPQSTLEAVSVGDQTFSSLAECVERAKRGWTSATAGMVTVGELYLMFGKNQQITLEYEIENEVSSSEGESRDMINEESKEKEMGNCIEADEKGTANAGTEGVEKVVVTSTATVSIAKSSSGNGNVSTSSCQLPSLVVEASNLASPLSKKNAVGAADEGVFKSPPQPVQPSSKIEEEEDKRKLEAENLSSMMAKLLYMIKVISSKGASNDVCICGSNNNNNNNNNTPSKSALNSLRSPSSNNRCLNGFLKSPGSGTKSPRNCSASLRSPKTPTNSNAAASAMGSPGGGHMDNPTMPNRNERVKPASAKRLIPEAPNEKSQGSNAVGDPVPLSARDKASEDQGEKLSGTVASNPEGSSGGSGEFRVPLGPAPRNHACQPPNSSFNAQLSKLLPRYSRPNRRSLVRKNMVVQRQLPLMPHPAKNSQGFVTLKVGNLQEFNITAAPSQISLPLNASIAPTPPSTSKEQRPLQPIASKDLLVPQNMNSGSPLVVQHPVSIPIVSSDAFGDKLVTTATSSSTVDSSNSISVNVSGQQLLTVKMPSYPVANHVTTVSSPASITQSTSVTLASSTSVTTTTACALPVMSDSFYSAKREDYQNSDTSSLSNILTQTLSDIPYLTTPPCTPLNTNGIQLDSLLNTPSDSKNELGSFNENSNSGLLSIADMEISNLGTPFKSGLISSTPARATFNESSLLNTPVNVGNPNKRTNSSDVSPIKLNLSTLLSSASDLLSSAQSSSPHGSASDVRVSSPNEDIPQIHIPECSESLPILDISIGGTISVKEQSTNVVHGMNVSPIVHSMPAISSIVDNITPESSEVRTIISTATNSIGVGVDTPGSKIENMGGMECNVINVLPPSNIVSEILETSSAAAVGSMPQITTLVDSVLSSPMTPGELVTESALRQSGILSTNPGNRTTGNSVNMSATRITTSIPSGDNSSSLKKESCGVDDSHLQFHQFQQESSDKILDITFSNSNSNSSFTSLLAAATSQPYLESVMESSLLQTPTRPMLSGAGVSGGPKPTLSFDGFDSLSTVPLSPPSSPSRLLRQTEGQWMNNEANEFSLSSLLGSIDSSPLKGGSSGSSNHTPASTNHQTQQQQQQNNNNTPPSFNLLHSARIEAMMSALNDNSVDFTATFANLKKQTKDINK